MKPILKTALSLLFTLCLLASIIPTQTVSADPAVPAISGDNFPVLNDEREDVPQSDGEGIVACTTSAFTPFETLPYGFEHGDHDNGNICHYTSYYFCGWKKKCIKWGECGEGPDTYRCCKISIPIPKRCARPPKHTWC